MGRYVRPSRRKQWPNDAEWARENSIVNARDIDVLSQPMLENAPMADAERTSRAGKICRLAMKIVQDLTQVGSKGGTK